jgi:hypothetical protein
MHDTLKEIQINVPEGTKTIQAVLVTPCVAVHRSCFPSGFKDDHWSVSDPRYGNRYPLPAFKTRAAAIKWARQLVSKFGDDPLAGAKWSAKKRMLIKHPTRISELKAFITETLYGS